ncbi:MAG: hypothetical protein WBD40_05110 [Tepidisphaeraceae bacterium]
MPTICEEIQRAVSTLPPSSQAKVLEFIRVMAQMKDADDAAIGEVGARLAAEVWPVEDFSDWIAACPPKREDSK